MMLMDKGDIGQHDISALMTLMHCDFTFRSFFLWFVLLSRMAFSCM